MTTREFLVAVRDSDVGDELIAKATDLLAALDARNEKRKGAESKEKTAARERRDAVLTFLQSHDGAWTRDQISFEIDMDPAKVSGACKGLIDAGLVEKSEVKIEKARKVAYSAVK